MCVKRTMSDAATQRNLSCLPRTRSFAFVLLAVLRKRKTRRVSDSVSTAGMPSRIEICEGSDPVASRSTAKRASTAPVYRLEKNSVDMKLRGYSHNRSRAVQSRENCPNRTDNRRVNGISLTGFSRVSAVASDSFCASLLRGRSLHLLPMRANEKYNRDEICERICNERRRCAAALVRICR